MSQTPPLVAVETSRVTSYSVSLSTIQASEVPAMTIGFTTSTAVAGPATLTVVADWAIFASATPLEAAVVFVGLGNCPGARGEIDAANRTLTIMVPSGCVLAPNSVVTIEVPSAFFAPNPPAGTTVVLTLQGSWNSQATASAGYVTGMHSPVLITSSMPAWGCLHPSSSRG